MKALKVLAVALLPSLFLGCVSSVNPLFTENDLIFNHQLLGDWSEGKLNYLLPGKVKTHIF